MDLLTRVAVAVVAATAAGLGLVAACQVAVPPGQFFSPQGITNIASYANAAPPTLLIGAGDYLVYAQGSSVYRLSKADPSTPELVAALDGEITSIVFDGQSTVAVCAGGQLQGYNPSTLAPVSFPSGIPGSCVQLAITQNRLAYVSAPDGGLTLVVSVALPDGGDAGPPVPLADAADPTRIGVGIVNSTTYYSYEVVAAAVPFTRRVPECPVVATGIPFNPKIVVFDGGDVPSLVARGSGDTLKRVDIAGDAAGPACCSLMLRPAVPLCHERRPLPEEARGGAGDFAVSGGYFYWSNAGLVSRLPIAMLSADGGLDAGPFVDIAGGAPIPSIVVDATNVYFILGNSIFRAPLPAGQ